jgi:hypothetical protein
MPAKGIYIYGIVPNFYGTTQFQTLENSGVYAITFQNISAIVSERDNAGIDSLDRESLGYLLVHHQKTIEDVQSKGFIMIIPMRLGTMAGSKEEVIRILSNGHDVIIETLKKIEYLTEIDLVVTWADFAGVLKEVSDLPHIKELKEELMKTNAPVTKVDQYKMGLLVQESIDKKNKAIELRILDALSPFGLDIKMHDVMNDEMITNSAFLINRNKQEKFELAIDKVDEEFKGLLNFKLVGPLPCYSFYTLEVKELNSQVVLQAIIELGLKEETSESDIKKSYLEKARIFHPDAHLPDGDDEKFNKINQAYHTMLDYSTAARHMSKDGHISLAKEIVNENLILVKVKE